MLTTIYLNGILGKRYGRKFTLDVSTPLEVIDAIDSGKPGFRDAYLDLPEYVFRVRVGKRYIGANRLTLKTCGKSISITPILETHANTKGIITTIAGVVLFVAGVLVHGTPLAPIGPFLISAGISLTFAGIASLIAGTPQTAIDNQSSKNKPSYQFSGVVNTAQQGGCIPVFLGGPAWIGSAVTSAGMRNRDITQGSGGGGGGGLGGDGTSDRGKFNQAVPAFSSHPTP